MSQEVPGIRIDVDSSNTFVPADVLPVFEEPEGLAILRSPIRVQATTEIDGATTYTATLSHPPLSGRQLHALLASAAPTGRPDSVRGVIDDWKLIDEPEETAGELTALHARLGEPWEEFMRSRPAFLRTLRDDVVPFFGTHSAVPVMFRVKTKTDRPAPSEPSSDEKNSLLYAGLQRRLLTLVAASELLASQGIESPEDTLVDIIRDTPGLKARQRALPLGPRFDVARRRPAFLESIRGLVTEELAEELSRDEWRRAQLNARNNAPRQLASVELSDGKTYEYDDWTYRYAPEEVRHILDNPRLRRMGNYVAMVASIINGPRGRGQFGFVEHLVVPGSVRRAEDAPYRKLSPVIQWQRQTDGHRHFLFPRSEAGSATEGENTIYTDGVLGALAVAYLSPEITRTWPATMQIGKGRSQQMGVAQVPVLALFPKYKGQLLESDFIAHAEAVAL